MFFTRVRCRDQGRAAEIPELDRLVAKTYCDFTWCNLVRRAGSHPIVEFVYTIARRTYKMLGRHGLVPALK